MRVYPQLTSGSCAQWPLHAETETRAVLHRAADGRTIAGGLSGRREWRWRLTYRDLNFAEKDAIVTLFEECGGGLRSFTFHDPLGNLLRWSEEGAQPVWRAEGGLAVDSLEGGGVRAVNAALTPRLLSQRVSVPAGHMCAFQCLVRCAGTASVALVRIGPDGELSREFAVDGEWRRVELSGRLSGEGEWSEFGWRVPAGSALEMQQPHVAAQAQVGGYRATQGTSGVFARARFSGESIAASLNEHGLWDMGVDVRAEE